MSTIEILLVITLALVCGFGIVVAQAIQLSRLFHTRAWYLLAAGLSLIGLRQIWGLIRLPGAILKAQAQGVLPEHLSTEQWVVIAAAFVAIGLLIAGFDKLRRDLARIGL